MNQSNALPTADAVPPLALSVPEAARAVSLSEPSLYRAWRRGDGPDFVVIGGRRLVTLDALRRWLAGHERKAA